MQNTRALQVARVEGSGWVDWGEPTRVFESLAGTPAIDLLIARLLKAQRRGQGLTIPLATALAAAMHS